MYRIRRLPLLNAIHKSWYHTCTYESETESCWEPSLRQYPLQVAETTPDVHDAVIEGNQGSPSPDCMTTRYLKCCTLVWSSSPSFTYSYSFCAAFLFNSFTNFSAADPAWDAAFGRGFPIAPGWGIGLLVGRHRSIRWRPAYSFGHWSSRVYTCAIWIAWGRPISGYQLLYLGPAVQGFRSGRRASAHSDIGESATNVAMRSWVKKPIVPRAHFLSLGRPFRLVSPRSNRGDPEMRAGALISGQQKLLVVYIYVFTRQRSIQDALKINGTEYRQRGSIL